MSKEKDKWGGGTTPPKKTIGFRNYNYYDDYDYDDYYGRGYNGKKSYGYGSSVSSYKSTYDWSRFYTSPVYEEDNDLIIKEPLSYLTPTSNEVKRNSAGIYIYEKDHISFVKELARYCYFKMIKDENYFSENIVEELGKPEEHRNLPGDFESKSEFLSNMWDEYIPGNTPLEQALNLYLKIKDSMSEDDKKTFKISEKLDEKKRMVGFKRNLYNDPTINEQLELNELSKKYRIGILNKMSLITEFGSQFKVEKEVDEKIVANSRVVKKKLMNDFSQYPLMDLYQKFMPGFTSKLITKQLTINAPIDNKINKQKIIIILDFSGSMHEELKQIWVNALLIDRFKYVLKGEAEVFFSYFVHEPKALSFQHIKDRQDVINFWQTFSNEPNGGGTEVQLMINKIASEIKGGKTLCNLRIDLSQEKPEILVINDGQDSINTDKFEWKVNSVCLFQENTELSKLCVTSGGKNVFVKHDGSLQLTSKEGVVQMK